MAGCSKRHPLHLEACGVEIYLLCGGEKDS